MSEYLVTLIDYTTGYRVAYVILATDWNAAEIYANSSTPLGWSVETILENFE